MAVGAIAFDGGGDGGVCRQPRKQRQVARTPAAPRAACAAEQKRLKSRVPENTAQGPEIEPIGRRDESGERLGQHHAGTGTLQTRKMRDGVRFRHERENDDMQILARQQRIAPVAAAVDEAPHDDRAGQQHDHARRESAIEHHDPCHGTNRLSSSATFPRSR